VTRFGSHKMRIGGDRIVSRHVPKNMSQHNAIPPTYPVKLVYYVGGDPSAGSPTDTLLRLNPPC